MKLGFVNFSTEEQGKLRQVIQSIQEHQAIDELGLGRIRDAFSNKMFPGMSTLHNRAKYYAVLPSLFLEAERGSYKNVNEVRAKILDLEIKLTRQLLLGSSSELANGITGSTVIDKAERDNDKYVKYAPTYIYYGALTTYGMIRSNINIYSLIMERSKIKNAQPPKYLTKEEEEEMGDANQLSGNFQLFDAGGLSYSFDGVTPISIDLTRDEANFIKSKILSSPKSKDSFLASILRDGYPLGENNEFFSLGDLWRDRMSDEHYAVYALSVRFSKFQYLLRLIYNYIYYSQTAFIQGRKDEADNVLRKYEELKELWKHEISNERIAEILDYVGGLITDRNSLSFCETACRLINNGDSESLKELQRLIISREKQTKGSTRSKLANPLKYKDIEHVGAYFFDYRWKLVCSVINEINKGLANG